MTKNQKYGAAAGAAALVVASFAGYQYATTPTTLQEWLLAHSFGSWSRTSWWSTPSSLAAASWHPDLGDNRLRYGLTPSDYVFSYRSENAGPHGFKATEAAGAGMKCLGLKNAANDLDRYDFSYIDGAADAVLRQACAQGCALDYTGCNLGPMPTPTATATTTGTPCQCYDYTHRCVPCNPTPTPVPTATATPAPTPTPGPTPKPCVPGKQVVVPALCEQVVNRLAGKDDKLVPWGPGPQANIKQCQILFAQLKQGAWTKADGSTGVTGECLQIP